MKIENAISFCEIYDILQHLDIALYNKIPSSVIKFIDDNRNKDYKVNIDYSKNINEQQLKRDTRIMLSIIYKDYLCSNEEREKLIKSDKIKLQQQNEQAYGYENIFNNRRKKIDCVDEVALVEYKESKFKKVINIIKKFFHIV